MTTLIRLSTSQIDSFDLVSGRFRQLRDRLFLNNCVAVLWTQAEIVVTGFDSPSDRTVLVALESLKLRKAGNLVQGRKFHSGVKYRERVYVMGGYSPQFLKLRSCESFDGRIWTPEANLVEARSGHSAVTCSDAIYVLGDNTSRSIERFDGVSWHLLPFSLMYDTTNLALVPLKNGTLMVIGGGSAAIGASDIVRVQDLRSEVSIRVDKLPAADYFKMQPQEYQGDLYCIGMKGIYVHKEGTWKMYAKDASCKLCLRWKCETDCKWIRTRLTCYVYLKLARLTLV